MKAVVFHGVGDIRLDSVSDPKLKEDTDALIVETVMKKGEGEKPTAPEANPQGDNWHPGDALRISFFIKGHCAADILLSLA